MTHRRHDDAGFTLVELLTVVVVVGILSAISLPSFLAQRERAAQGAAVSSLRNVLNVVPELSAGASGFPGTGEVITTADEVLGDYAFVDDGTAAPDSNTVSVGTSADTSHVVFATVSATGECFFLRVHDDGGMDRHRDTGTGTCSASALDAATAGAGW